MNDNPNRARIGSRLALYEAIEQAANRATGAAVLMFLIADEVAARGDAGLRRSDHALSNLGSHLAASLEPDEQLFRFNNAEYAIVLTKNEASELRAAVQRLRGCLRDQDYDTPGGPIALQVGVGLEAIRHNGNVETLLLRARRAATSMEPAPDDARTEILMDNSELWNTRIRQAIRQDRLSLVYQSLVAIKQDAPEHYDVLIRMFNSEGQEIPPANFLPAADSHGLMPLIDRWVLQRVLEVMQTRSANGQATCMLVRLSEATVIEPDDFIEHIRSELKGFKLGKQRLAFSIPQQVLMDNLREAKRLTQGLTQLKCGLVIDRFGVETGCERLLEELRPAYVKLDPSLTPRADGSSDRIGPNIRLAHKHRARVIVPQVESSEALVELAKLGPDFLQGHRIQQPALAMINKGLEGELRQAQG